MSAKAAICTAVRVGSNLGTEGGREGGREEGWENKLESMRERGREGEGGREGERDLLSAAGDVAVLGGEDDSVVHKRHVGQLGGHVQKGAWGGREGGREGGIV